MAFITSESPCPKHETAAPQRHRDIFSHPSRIDIPLRRQSRAADLLLIDGEKHETDGT